MPASHAGDHRSEAGQRSQFPAGGSRGIAEPPDSDSGSLGRASRLAPKISSDRQSAIANHERVLPELACTVSHQHQASGMRFSDRRTRRIAIGAAIVTCILIAFVSVRTQSEPIYKGKRLGNWIPDLQKYETDSGFHPPADADAVKALRASGSAAIPYLVKWLSRPERMEDARVIRLNKLTAILIRVPFFERMLFSNYQPPIPSKDTVTLAFYVLGPKAKSAIPGLVKIADDALRSMPASKQDVLPRNYESFHYALQSLAFVGPDAVPALLSVATNFQGYHIQWEVINSFQYMGTNGVAAVPALLNWTRDKDSWVRAAAMRSLGEIGQQPRLIIPYLRAALKDQDWMVRRDAAEALGNFGAEAEAAVPDLVTTPDDVD
jgi:hypothetical protein